ncbi:DUF58 domain-containing protein [bacterium]|nr:DUF58 domain-containing protein [bacterium]
MPAPSPTRSGGRPTAGVRAVIQRLRAVLGPERGTRVITEVLQGSDPNRYLDPGTLARLAISPLVAKLVVEGFLTGLHKSPYHGFSVEFADHREYVAGDDLKFLDWALYARTDHFYIKRFEEETNLRCQLLLDRSGSMLFGTGHLTKWDYSCFLATCLAYLMLRQQDAVGLSLFGATPGVVVPPRCRTSHLRQIMQVMIQNPPGGGTALASSLRAILRNLKRRSLVVVISDLIDEPEETLRVLRLIRGHRHDVIVFHVQDASELEFDFDGATMFRDLETGEELEIHPPSVRETYRRQLTELCEFFRKGLTEVGIDYQLINTHQPYDYALAAYLQRRARTRR